MMKKNKQSEWNKIERWAREVVDGVGCSIDEGIFQTVVVLNALGFMTTMSCEGHLDNRGSAAPWVYITALIPEEEESLRKKIKSKWVEIEQLSKEASPEEIKKLSNEYHGLINDLKYPNLRIAKKLATLLTEFYEKRKVSYSQRLVLTTAANDIRLMSQGGLFQEIQSKSEKKKRLKEFQKEMNDFTEFLRKKYFES